ncbi:MAG: hypothetical protein FWG50_13910 [Kiritimatiellaeota bacterium]|nr:hypothetical protein [Kiritimatiellota bacterium]
MKKLLMITVCMATLFARSDAQEEVRYRARRAAICSKRMLPLLLSMLIGVLPGGAAPLEIKSPNLEPPRQGKPYPPIEVSVGGGRLLSHGCPVTASIETPERGEWAMITDGNKELDNGVTLVKFAPGVQWVQVDLRTSQVINAVCVWRHAEWSGVCRDMVVRLSDDADFGEGATTVFNNDHDNSAGLGAGGDKEYIETNRGRPISVPSLRARYVRVYGNGMYLEGRRFDPFNYCSEIEVYGGETTSEEKMPIKFTYPRPMFK